MPSSIATVLRYPRLYEVDRFAVASNPRDTWAFVRSTCLYDLPWVGAALAAVSARERVLHRARHAVTSASRRPPLVAGIGYDAPLPWLAERPGSEFITGGIARFWEPAAPLREVAAADFDAFDEPGYGKLAWSLQVDPRESGGSWIGIELRGDATDDEGWERLEAYWNTFAARSRTARRAIARALIRRLGKPLAERALPLPGDGLLASPPLCRTHGVTIEAPPDCVWPWLAQMGCHRAGWYSLDSLYNGGNRSLRMVRAELQHPKVGDAFAMSPRPGDVLSALRVEPNRALVLGSPELLQASPPSDPEEELVTWAFVLEPIGDHATRLLVRLRRDQEVNMLDAALRPLAVARHEIMQRIQLRNLEWLAEALARSRSSNRPEGDAPA